MRGQKYYFILIDYDMGVVVPANTGGTYKATTRHRTGTLPFMAHQLLADAWNSTVALGDWTHIKHYLHHDFQSVFWVSLFCTQTVETPGISPALKARMLAFVKSWETGSLGQIHLVKYGICMGRARIKLPLAAKCLSKWVLAWIHLFRKVDIKDGEHDLPALSSSEADDSDAEETEPWDAETIGGAFSRDTIKAALTQYMPFKQDIGDEEELIEDEGDDSDDEEEFAEEKETQDPEAEVVEDERERETAKTPARKATRRKPRAIEVFSDMRARLRSHK